MPCIYGKSNSLLGKGASRLSQLKRKEEGQGGTKDVPFVCSALPLASLAFLGEENS